MSKLYIFILNERKHVNGIKVDGISGKVYQFLWNKEVGFYTYEPKSQDEIDDIMQSQFHGIFYYSLCVPGLFDAPKVEEAKKDTPKLEATPPAADAVSDEPSEPEATEPEEATPFDPVTHFESVEDVAGEVAKFEDKEQLTSIIEAHAGTPPSSRTGIPKFQAAATEAILASREESSTDSEEDKAPEQVDGL